MDALNNSLSASSDPKAALMRQVQEEAAINNARQLISVTLSLLPFSYLSHINSNYGAKNTLFLEDEQPLL